jgi:hypothetical protein
MATSFHRLRLLAAGLLIMAIILGGFIYGFDYYRMDAQERVFSEKHRELRPSGSIGVKLGTLGMAMFFCLYAYPVRKKWRWLQRFGKTKNWLDFHILLGVSAPLIITLHSSFKFQGLAGVAYWLMMAVMASGFVGRYIYAQIPKSLNETALSLDEIEKMCSAARADLARQHVIAGKHLEAVLRVPDAGQVEEMSMGRALLNMMWRDLGRPFQTAGLRRAAARSLGENIRTLLGFLPSSNAELEDVVRLARRQSRLVTKVAFLGRANQIFQLWHVVHRPFSYSFAVLASVHVTLVLLLGYY